MQMQCLLFLTPKKKEVILDRSPKVKAEREGQTTRRGLILRLVEVTQPLSYLVVHDQKGSCCASRGDTRSS